MSAYITQPASAVSEGLSASPSPARNSSRLRPTRIGTSRTAWSAATGAHATSSHPSAHRVSPMDKMSQLELVDRCKALGWSLKYKFDGHALHTAFRGNDHQWIVFRNWESKTFKSLHDVAKWASAETVSGEL